MNYGMILAFLIEFLVVSFDDSPRRCKVEWFQGEELVSGTNYIYPDYRSAMQVGVFWQALHPDYEPAVTCVFDREVA